MVIRNSIFLLGAIHLTEHLHANHLHFHMKSLCTELFLFIHYYISKSHTILFSQEHYEKRNYIENIIYRTGPAKPSSMGNYYNQVRE